MCLNHIDIQPESRLFGDFGADSLDMIDLAQTLEEEFKIVIDEYGLSSFHSVEDVVRYVANKLNK